MLDDLRADQTFETALVQLRLADPQHLADAARREVHRAVAVAAQVLEGQQAFAQQVIRANEGFEAFRFQQHVAGGRLIVRILFHRLSLDWDSLSAAISGPMSCAR